jgi:hypothetical protein
MSKKCKAFSQSYLGLEEPNNRKAFYNGWEAAKSEWVGLSRGEKLGIIDRHTMRSCDDQQDMLLAIMGDTNDLLKEKNT